VSCSRIYPAFSEEYSETVWDLRVSCAGQEFDYDEGLLALYRKISSELPTKATRAPGMFDTHSEIPAFE
jgi:hypothetical protein